MVQGPIIAHGGVLQEAGERIAANGQSFAVHEWRGSGPPYMHVHYADDEAWHVLEGTLQFRFADGEIEATAGSTVFVPAGVPHTYAASDDARYLVILTPRLRDLIAELQGSRDMQQVGEIMRRYQSEILQ